MRPHDDPATMTAEERLREVAVILAAGILRRHSRAGLPANPTERLGTKNPTESRQNCLDVRDETVLTVHRS